MLRLWSPYCSIFVSDTQEVMKLRGVSQLFFPHQESWEKFCYCPCSFSLSHIMWLDNLRSGLEAWAWAPISIISRAVQMIHLVVQQSCDWAQSTGTRIFSSAWALSAGWLLYFISADHLERWMIRAFGILSSGINVGKPTCCYNKKSTSLVLYYQ